VVDVCHSIRFHSPVYFRILQDAEGIDPYVFDAAELCKVDSVLEDLG
jgi:hypothetical protein